jgi:hypothetical protein
MDQKLSFEMTRESAPDCYTIRLLDRSQIAALALAEGCPRSVAAEPILVVFDEGGGELSPIEGYDDTTARGRIVSKILASIYCEALGRIAPQAGEGSAASSGGLFVFHDADGYESRPRRSGT